MAPEAGRNSPGTGKAGSRRPVVMVTGASAGVGRAVVREFARHGADIGLIARGREGLNGAAEDVRREGGRALILPLDVADGRAVEDAAERLESELGPISIWINAAFVGMLSRFMDMTPEEFRRVTDVTYLGQVHGTRAALKRMLPRGEGSIVLVGSALAYRGIPLQSAYCGAKHAIQGFHDSVRSELFHDRSRVRISMVQLPGVNTPQFDWIRTNLPKKPKPASPPYQPEIAARAIRFAALHDRKELWLAWPTWQAIVGDFLASSLLDRYLGAIGVSGQQDAEDVDPARKDNLFAPVDEDRGAHGRFDRVARTSSPQFWLATHAVFSAAALLILLLALVWLLLE